MTHQHGEGEDEREDKLNHELDAVIALETAGWAEWSALDAATRRARRAGWAKWQRSAKAGAIERACVGLEDAAVRVAWAARHARDLATRTDRAPSRVEQDWLNHRLTDALLAYKDACRRLQPHLRVVGPAEPLDADPDAPSTPDTVRPAPRSKTKSKAKSKARSQAPSGQRHAASTRKGAIQ